MKAVLTFYVFLILTIFEDALTQSPPQLTTKNASRQQIVRPGTNILVECPVRNTRDMIFEWYKDKETIMTYGNHRLRVLSNGSLRIKETIYDDTGVYRCRAVNGFGSVEFNTTLLVIGNEEDYEEYEAIFDPEDALTDESKISITAKPQILYVTEGKSPIFKPLGATFMLQCVATGYPKPEIMWYKDGTPISNQFRLGRWALKFTKTISTDAGNYTCVASNQLGKASHSFVLEVDEPGRKIRGKPLITGYNTTVQEGQRAVMECGVESSSLPHIEWLKQVHVDDANSDPGKHAISMKGEYFSVLTKPFLLDYVLKDDVYYHKLMIENAQLEDAGKYVCLGANTDGYDYHFTYLEVIPKDNGYHSTLSFPIVVTVIVVAGAVLGCIFALLFYCRPRRGRRPEENSVDVSMVTKEGFIPMHTGPSDVLKSPIKSGKPRSTHSVTYVSGLSNGGV
ncbi:Fibroblast growth factor receptor-like 1 [Araneus ventricosus]|uniref:receptor protein-tyrosine kinase n=1 Tax=Araneus ventricosus TaxID=182803 RepID=A0A4Y2BB08_ARAVE|nr:Fibroblast growth factor receptor-like 1 [Araneus ventricosus]